MNAQVVLGWLVLIPMFLALVFAYVDLATRSDISVVRKVVLAVLLFFVVPAVILYLLARPPSVVGHRDEDPAAGDWRSELVARLEATSAPNG